MAMIRTIAVGSMDRPMRGPPSDGAWPGTQADLDIDVVLAVGLGSG
jgi:hypothetical protein